MEFNASLGLTPGDPLCDRAMSPDEWNRTHPTRRITPTSSARKSPIFVRAGKKYEFINSRTGRRKHVEVVRNSDTGEETPRYWPMDTKTGVAYEDVPF